MPEPATSAAAWRGQPLHGLLFDLDGTLLDTASDIARALNRALAERGWQDLRVSDVTHMIGRGAPILIDRAAAALGQHLEDGDRAHLLERFFHHYGALEEGNESDAQPYPGVLETLPRLHAAGLRIAVVTNKQWRFANELLNRLGLMKSIRVVVGGDTCEKRKPDPQPLLFACAEIAASPAQVLMVGDSVNDVSAARAANIPIVCVPYGYNEGRDPRSLACDAMIDSVADLPELLFGPGGLA